MRSSDCRKFRLLVVHSRLGDAIAEERKMRNPAYYLTTYWRKILSTMTH